MNYWWYLLTVSRKRNQNEFAWKNTKKLTTYLIIALVCFRFFQANLILVPFPAHRQQVPSFYKSCTQTFMKCTQSTAANKPSLKWNMSVVRSWLDHIEYCSSLLIHASFQSNSLSFTASECFYFTLTFNVLRFIYTEQKRTRKRFFPLIFVTTLYKRWNGFSLNPSGTDVTVAFAPIQMNSQSPL